MKLKDLKRFAVESQPVPGNSERLGVNVVVLREQFHEKTGSQAQQHSITLSARGATNKESLEKGLERTLSFLDRVKDKAFAVRGGIVQMGYNKETKEYTALAQIGLFDEGDGFTQPKVKSLSAFFTHKNPDKAEDGALELVLKTMGEA